MFGDLPLPNTESRSPSPSPSRRTINTKRSPYSDRFIPIRSGRDLQTEFSLLEDRDIRNDADAARTFSELLRSELFGADHSSKPPSLDSNGVRTPPRCSSPNPSTPLPTTPRNLLTYKTRTSSGSRRQTSGGSEDLPTNEIYSLSPVRFDSQKLLLSPRKQPRVVSKVPFKVLDAPELQDDFYLNLIDWGSNNTLGVGLGNCCYLWHAHSGKVVKLCDLGPSDSVTSVSWIQRGTHIALGTNRGLVHIWDTERHRRVRTMSGHTSRVGSLAWNDYILSSGGRDRLIYHRDVRSPDHYLRRLTGHKQEVCGLKWNCEDNQLASGGNDNKLFVWDRSTSEPVHRFTDHTAAVKAISWSPHQHGLLASGGGTADRRIKFWNTLTGQSINEIDTGSQVCNLAWSKNSNELVSTHGYSQNQIIVWKYPSMTQVATLTGHSYRVLYLAMSPDGQTVVTGAGDETLRFWNVFGKSKSDSRNASIFDPYTKIR